jgi:hypothetical protein
MSIVKIGIPFILSRVVMTLQRISLKMQLTPKKTIEAPIKVAVCPPLALGGTPSI